MDPLQCPRCGKGFQRIQHLASHLRRKKPCDAGLRCEKCRTVYNHRSSLSRHRAHCTGAAEGSEVESRLVVLAAEVEELRRARASMSEDRSGRGGQPPGLSPGGQPPGGAAVQAVQAAVVGCVSHVGVTNHITNITNIGQINSCHVIHVAAPPPPPAPGWPAKWPHPPVQPRSFYPPTFDVRPEQLVLAASTLTPQVAAAYLRGEPEAQAALFVELTRQIHCSAPSERNIYPDPCRADRALVSQPGRWEIWQLLDAIRVIFGRIAGELRDISPAASPETRRLVEMATEGIRDRCDEVVQSSRKAMAAHLENVRLMAQYPGVDWLGDPQSAGELRSFGRERISHLDLANTVNSLELGLGVYAAADLTPERVPEIADRAVREFAKMALHRHPENLTVIPWEEGRVMVHTRGGWVIRPVEVAATEQAHWAARNVAEYVEAAAAQHGLRALAALGPYLRERSGEVAGRLGRSGEILSHYLRSAADYYGRLPSAPETPTMSARDGRYEAQRLLFGPEARSRPECTCVPQCTGTEQQSESPPVAESGLGLAAEQQPQPQPEQQLQPEPERVPVVEPERVLVVGSESVPAVEPASVPIAEPVVRAPALTDEDLFALLGF